MLQHYLNPPCKSRLHFNHSEQTCRLTVLCMFIRLCKTGVYHNKPINFTTDNDILVLDLHYILIELKYLGTTC